MLRRVVWPFQLTGPGFLLSPFAACFGHSPFGVEDGDVDASRFLQWLCVGVVRIVGAAMLSPSAQSTQGVGYPLIAIVLGCSVVWRGPIRAIVQVAVVAHLELGCRCAHAGFIYKIKIH